MDRRITADEERAVACLVEMLTEDDSDTRAIRAALHSDGQRGTLLRKTFGKAMLRKYRRATGNATGAIDWDAFREWLKEHWPDILKALISVLLIILV